jgi:CDP-diacylglycerol--glycerol-3-phosphate 3-phosphatidyltransferase
MEYSGKKSHFYLVSAITLYRLAAAPVIAVLVYFEAFEIFRWLIAISFFTDAIDGFLARKLRVQSRFGARIDSIADDLTLAVAIYGAAVFKGDFFQSHLTPIVVMIALFVIQYGASLWRYGKVSSFHTYLAKAAMVLQGTFIILLFFLPNVPVLLFYAAVAVTVLELLEEIILVALLPQWQENVKGLYWIMKGRKKLPG